MKQISTIICSAFIACSTFVAFAGNNPKVIIAGQDPSKIPFKMNPKLVDGEDYMSKTIIFNMKPAYRQNCQATSINGILPIQDLLNSVGGYSLAKIYPTHQPPAEAKNALGQDLVDISLIYSFKYTSDLKIEKIMNRLISMGYCQWVDLWIIPKIDFTPNDPSYSNSGQYFCKGNVAGSIDCQTAWNTQQGNASVIVGIVDTGTQPTHPDLAANYDGGFDVAMNDADPTWQGNNHGCAVSGDACAVTNNSTGVASPGFKCHFKCAKIADAAGTLTASYAGITWAADNGCKIINCSWGGSGGGPYGQTIVDYATINKNCVLICSAGNSNLDEELWPSSYNNVYRVAATTNTDARASFSTYGSSVDFGSPGNGIYSTIDGTSYGSMSGTSMASPVAAGAAGIVQAQFNYTNAFQIGERLKWTTDPYAGASTLTLFNAGKLGTGRIDLAKAVSAMAAKSLAMNPINITDGNDNAFMQGETLSISGTFINYLDPSSSSASATLTVGSVSSGTAPNITNGTFTIGALASLATNNNNSAPFTAVISASAPINQVINFVVTITDGAFTGKQYFSVTVNPDYINIVVNDLYTTITSKGKVGYNNDGQQQGLGIAYQIPINNNMLYEMSLMIGNSSTKVSDMFRETSAGNTDFASVTRVYKVTPNTVSDFDVDGKFNDAPSATGALPVQVHHSAYAWSTAPYRKFVIVKYVVKNTGGSTLSNLCVGLVADWDITSAGQNKSGYDATNNMGYCNDISTPTGIWSGTKLLTGTANNYCLDNIAGGNGGVDPTTDFLTAEKYTVLSTSRNADGFGVPGGDVMNCVSKTGITLNAGDSVVVAFALIGGDNLADLQNSACQAQAKWDNTGPCVVGVNEVTADNFWMNVYPNPATSNVTISYDFKGDATASFTIYNSIGETVKTVDHLSSGKNSVPVDISELKAGNYFVHMNAGGAIVTKQFTIVK